MEDAERCFQYLGYTIPEGTTIIPNICELDSGVRVPQKGLAHAIFHVRMASFTTQVWLFTVRGLHLAQPHTEYFEDPHLFSPERYLLTPHGTKPGVEDSAFRDDLAFGFGRVCTPPR